MIAGVRLPVVMLETPAPTDSATPDPTATVTLTPTPAPTVTVTVPGHDTAVVAAIADTNSLIWVFGLCLLAAVVLVLIFVGAHVISRAGAQ